MVLRVSSACMLAAFAVILAVGGCDDTSSPKMDGSIPQPTPVPVEDNIIARPTVDIMAALSTEQRFTGITSALQVSGLDGPLRSPGPYTVFAPTNDAIDNVPVATRRMLMSPSGKARLIQILGHHIVPGRLTQTDLTALAAANGGVAMLTTLQGDRLSVRLRPEGDWEITDSQGSTALITAADELHSNGVVHVIDQLLMAAE